MLKPIRRTLKRVPLLGPWLHHLYLVLCRGEGQTLTIQSGLLEGMKFRRFMHTYNPAYFAGDYEQELQESFRSLIRPGQVVYDVGANVGFMTLVAARLVGPAGKVVAFEPGPRTARELRAQVRLNRLTTVTVVECAVSDRAGEAELVTSAYSVTASLASGPPEDAGPATRRVRTTTLDEAAREFGVPDLIKIDIEGAEILALEGARVLLRSRRPALVVELHSDDLSRRFHTLMDEAGYEVNRPDGERAEPGRFERFVVATARGS